MSWNRCFIETSFNLCHSGKIIEAKRLPWTYWLQLIRTQISLFCGINSKCTSCKTLFFSKPCVLYNVLPSASLFVYFKDCIDNKWQIFQTKNAMFYYSSLIWTSRCVMITNETNLDKRPNDILSQNLTFHFYDETSWNLEWYLGFFLTESNQAISLPYSVLCRLSLVYISAYFQRSQRW